MNGVVSFDYSAWALRYPELATSVPQPLAQQYFWEAQLYCDNSPGSIIQDVCLRTVLLNMVTAHIAALNAPLNGEASSPLVGRISNATEGSVSVGTQLDMPAGSAQWYSQTKHGLAFWQATVQFRSMRYVPGPMPIANPWERGPWRR
jgi:hypothetical protein